MQAITCRSGTAVLTVGAQSSRNRRTARAVPARADQVQNCRSMLATEVADRDEWHTRCSVRCMPHPATFTVFTGPKRYWQNHRARRQGDCEPGQARPYQYVSLSRYLHVTRIGSVERCFAYPIRSLLQCSPGRRLRGSCQAFHFHRAYIPRTVAWHNFKGTPARHP